MLLLEFDSLPLQFRGLAGQTVGGRHSFGVELFTLILEIGQRPLEASLGGGHGVLLLLCLRLLLGKLTAKPLQLLESLLAFGVHLLVLTGRPAIDSIALEATTDARGATGVAVLTRTPSPFGMSLSADGHVMYDVHLQVSGLPADPHVYDGASSYVAWATVPDLSIARRLGPVGTDGSAAGHVEWNKFIVLVTAEKSGVAPHWAGAILLKGASPSTWMQRYQSHTLNNGGNPQW